MQMVLDTIRNYLINGRIEFFLVTIIIFLIYDRTLYPTVSGGDSGELVSSLCSGAILHPPGYPLFSLIYGVWIRTMEALQLHNVAYLANILTCIRLQFVIVIIY